MDMRNLVLEIDERESAADVQARLDKASEDGYFLVNVVGRLAFLRTTVTPKKPEPVSVPKRLSNRDGKDEAAETYISARPEMSLPALVNGLEELGIVRKKTWVSSHRAALRKNGSDRSE